MTDDDGALLRQFSEEHSEEAFRALVERRVGLVYATALRQVGGDVHLAHEVTQGVFIDLARKAGALAGRTTVAGWLYTSVRFAAAKALRSRVRRLNHETEAQVMQEVLATETTDAVDWNELRPVLDAAMHELGGRDREAILLRYFEGRSLAEVGAAVGLAENSARMRVERALEKLRGRLARRGITSTAAALGAVLAAQPAVAVPAGLVASATGAGLAAWTVGGGVTTATLAVNLWNFMNWSKAAGGTLAAVAAVSIGAWLGANYQERAARTGDGPGGTAGPAGEVAALRAENGRLRAELKQGGRGPGSGAAAVVSATGGGRTGDAALEALRTLLDLKRRNLVAPQVKLVGDGATVTDEFAELFGLTANERTTLQSGIEAARERLEKLERENTTVTRNAAGDVLIAMKPYPEEGGAAYDALQKVFEATLGAERYRAFLSLDGEQTEKALGRFGTMLRTVTVSRDTGADGEVRYRIREKTSVTPEDNSNYLSDRMTYEQLVHEVGGLAKVLPADFVPRK